MTISVDPHPKKKQYLKWERRRGEETHQAITATPANAAKQLNTSATTPLAVNPSGKRPGGFGASVKSKKSFSLPAALPAVGMFWALQASRWDGGMERDCWRREGASMMVAIRPDATCHSMWQWKSQMRGEEDRVLAEELNGKRGGD